MQLLLDHFWKILLVVLLVVGGSYFFNQREKSQRWDQTVKKFATYLDTANTDYKKDPKEVQGRYWEMLNYVQDVRNNLRDGKLKVKRPSNRDAEGDPDNVETALRWAMEAAVESNGISFELPIHRHLLNVVKENIAMADKLGLYDTQQNRLAMVKGEPPTVNKGAFKGDKAILTNRIPVVIAREVRNHPMNLAIAPETVAGAIGDDVDEEVYRNAGIMKDSSAIQKKSFEAVKQWYDQANK